MTMTPRADTLVGALLTALLAATLPAKASAQDADVPAELSPCAALFDPVGVPSGRDGADERDYFYADGLVPTAPPGGNGAPRILYKCYGKGFAVRLNTVTRVPDWVAEDITPEELGTAAERSDNFFEDAATSGYSSLLKDYARSGFDRGHQAPAGDFTADQAMQDETFVMSNMGPQVGACFNRGIWKDLETSLRTLVTTRQRLIVFTGPVYGERLQAIGDLVKDKAGVQLAVPEAYFKVVYAPRDKRAMAYLISNAKHCHESYADRKFQVAISDLEDKTGFTFFAALPQRLQSILKAEPSVAWNW